MKNSPATQLLAELQSLQQKYLDLFDQTADIKALKGVESCIELKMKIYGFDGKTPAQGLDPTDPEPEIDLSKLSENTLNEMIKIGINPKTIRNAVKPEVILKSRRPPRVAPATPSHTHTYYEKY